MLSASVAGPTPTPAESTGFIRPGDLPYCGMVGSDVGRALSGGARRVAVATVAALAFVGCTSEPETERATVTPTSAYTAIVRWEIEQNEPVVDADGNVEAPIIYLAAGSGGTVDARVQADVVSDIDDDAVIRFTDDPTDARDEQLEGEPVKDDGVMILVDEFESDQVSVEARIARYVSADDDHAWVLELTATDDGAVVDTATRATE